MIAPLMAVGFVLAAQAQNSGGVIRSLVPIALVAFAIGAAVGFERTRARLGGTSGRRQRRFGRRR